MFNLGEKFYGLTLKSWIIIFGLLIIFYYFVYTRETSVCLTTTTIPKIEITKELTKELIKEIKKEKFVNSENKMSNLIKVYNFNTSWCGYSVRFQPEWDKFQKEIKSRNELANIQAYDIKCDNASNKQMCINYEIPGFPTIIIEKDNKKIDYNGPRTSDAIIESIINL